MYTRTLARAVEITGSEQKKLRGYAAVFYRADDPGTEFRFQVGKKRVVERIMPGAFDEWRNEGGRAYSSFNHDDNYLLGREDAGTLRVGTDSVGLWYEVDLPDTQAGRDVATLHQRGDLDGSSFRFDIRNGSDVKRNEGDLIIWEQRALNVAELGPVVNAAYKSTNSHLRSETQEMEGWLADQIQRDRDYADASIALLEAEGHPLTGI